MYSQDYDERSVPEYICDVAVGGPNPGGKYMFIRWSGRLDPYIKNWEIWKCPSAQVEGYWGNYGMHYGWSSWITRYSWDPATRRCYNQGGVPLSYIANLADVGVFADTLDCPYPGNANNYWGWAPPGYT
jgi:hypothetical protein